MKLSQMPSRTMRTIGTARVLGFVVVLVLLTLLVNLGLAVSAVNAAGPIYVDRTDDPTPIPSACTSASNDCSFRGAVVYANAHPNTEIVLANATYTLSDAADGTPQITANTTIDFGACSNCVATIQGGAGWNHAIISVGTGATVQMTRVTIQNGNSPSEGGGIYNAGDLTLNSVTVKNNTVVDMGGGIYNYQTAKLTIINSSILSNTVTITSSFGGGGVFSFGTLSISGSTIAYNTSASYGGGINAMGVMTLTNTSVMTNTTTKDGGGIYAGGKLTITGGAVSSNTVTTYSGGGIYYNGTGPVTISGTTISGNKAKDYGAGIYASGGATVTLTGVAVNGNTLGGTSSGSGGGICHMGGALIVQGNSTVNGNGILGYGFGAGMYVNNAALTMTNGTVSNNTILGYGFGGGINLQTTASSIMTSTISNNNISILGSNTGYGGGLQLNVGALTMAGSTVMSNTITGLSGQGYGGGIETSTNTTLTLTTSTVSGNSANEGGGILPGGTLSITNSTLSGNTATTGPGGAISSQLNIPVTLSSVTLVGNQAPNSTGGGILASFSATLKNSLIAGNTAANGPDCYGTILSQGYNLVGNGQGCSGLTNGVGGDQVGNTGTPIDPLVGALGNNGGPTFTRALLLGSPAINAANPNAANCPATDQRGVTRPQYSRCDIGAYEYNAPQIISLNPPSIRVGSSTFTLTVNGSNFISNSVVRWNGSNRTTTYVNSGQLTAQIPSSDISSVGTASVTVFNPTPGGDTSNSVTFTIWTGPNLGFLPLVQKQ